MCPINKAALPKKIKFDYKFAAEKTENEEMLQITQNSIRLQGTLET